MLYTSNEEFDLERRVHLTNEIPPYDMYEALNSTLQYKVDQNGNTVPTIWKWVLGSSKVGYNLPYSIRREDEDGEFEDGSASSSIVGRYNIVRDEPDEYGDTPYDNNEVYFKSVNGKLSPVYGPKVEGNTEQERRVYGLNTKYHSIAIDGVWLPEFDLLLHENYRYLENLYPDHPDYRFLLTNNEIDDSFNAAGAVVDFKPANKFYDKVAQSLNTFSNVKGASMSEDEIEQEAIKIKIRNLRNNAFRRKFYGSKIGYKMLGGDIFNNVSVFPVATYLPIKDVKAADLSLEEQIKNCFSDESEKQADILNAKNRKDSLISNSEKNRDEKISNAYHSFYDPLKELIDQVQKWYISANEKMEKSSPYSATYNCKWGKFKVSNLDSKKYKWNENSNTLVENESGDFKAQFEVRAYYDSCLEKFNSEVDAILENSIYIKVKTQAEDEHNKVVEEANKEYEESLKEIEEKYAAIDTLKEWNKKNGKSFSAEQFLKYCRKNNRVIDTYSELYYRKFRLIDWKGEKNSFPTEPENIYKTTGVCLPFNNKYIYIKDTSEILVNDIIKRDEQERELTYVSEVEKDRIKVTQDNIVDYKTLFLYQKPTQIELSSKDTERLANNYHFVNKKYSVVSPQGDVLDKFERESVDDENWIDEFYDVISEDTRKSIETELKVVEWDNKLFPEPHFALEQYSSSSELRGERNLENDLIYPVENTVTITNNYISKFDKKVGDQLPEISVISSFNKGLIEFAADGDIAIANASYSKVSLKDDQRYALLIQNENKNEILIYGTPVIKYGDAGLGMSYIQKVSFYITGIPSEKPQNFIDLTGTDKENRAYFFGEEIEYEDSLGNEKTQERLIVYPECKVLGMWEVSVVNTTDTTGDAESYHKTEFGKIDRIIESKITNINLGYFNVLPVVVKNKLVKEYQTEEELILDNIDEVTLNICRDSLPEEFQTTYTVKNSILNEASYSYENVENKLKTELSSSIKSIFDTENNLTIQTVVKETIEIEAVLDGTDEDLQYTLKFENETAKKVMKTLSVGDRVFGVGIDSDDNDVFITKLGDNYVEISSPVQATGAFILNFEVKKNIFPSSIYDKPEYFRKELIKFNTYEKLNPFNNGLYGSKSWPNTSKAIIDGLDDISFYDDYKTPNFPTVMKKCHSLVNDTKDENGNYIYRMIPSTIKFMNDLFVDININRVLSVPTFDNKKSECLMSVDWLDYFTNNLSAISRATDRTNIGAHLTMQTDTTGLTSNESGREFTDPNINLKFITLNWDNMKMWPEVKKGQTEWTVPAYAQIGTNGAGYRKLFRNVDEITWPNVWGATTFDNTISSKSQKELELSGGVLRKRGTWGQDHNYVEPSESDKKYYYSVEEPVFEVPLGEYDTQIDYKFDISDVTHALTKVQASFYKERFDTIMKYTPTNDGEIEDETNKISLNKEGALKHDFIEGSLTQLQVANLEKDVVGEKTPFAKFDWKFNGDWVPSKKEENGKYIINYPEVEDVDGQIQYFTIWTGKQLNDLYGNGDSFKFEDHSIIFKKPNCPWEYRNFISGGIYGDGVLSFSSEDEESYINECMEAYKSWEPNPHMKFNGDLLVSITRWILAVSDMGGYLNLNAVDKLTFKPNTDLMDEYRSLDDLVWTSDDVDHAMDTTCYWFMYAGASENSNFKLFETYLNWKKGSLFGVIRDNEGEYHIFNFKDSNQFSITMPLKRTQGQAFTEFDFISNDSKYGLINRSATMNSKFTLPRKFITPGSYKFDFTLDQRFTGQGQLYEKEESGEWSDKIGSRNVYCNISRSNIYFDSINNRFYTFAEIWNEEKKEFESGPLSKIAIQFNENSFFKNVLTSVVKYSLKKELNEGKTEEESVPTLENISSIPFATEKLSSDDRILEIRKVLLRSIWNKTLEPTFFSNYAELTGKIKGFTANNEIILGSDDKVDALNFEIELKNLGKLGYNYNSETNTYETFEIPFEEGGLKFSASDSPLLSSTNITYSEISKNNNEKEQLEKASFKFFKNNLILKGKVNLENPSVVYSDNAKFLSGIKNIQLGDALVDGKALSATSEKTKNQFSLKNEYGNNVRSTFKCCDMKFVGNEFVSISKNGIIYYNKDAEFNGETSLTCNEFTTDKVLSSVAYNGDWIILTDDGVYKFDIENPSLTRIWSDTNPTDDNSPYNIGESIYKKSDNVEVVYSNGKVFVKHDSNWRNYEIQSVVDFVLTTDSVVLRTDKDIYVIDIFHNYCSKVQLVDEEAADNTEIEIKLLKSVKNSVFISGKIKSTIEKESETEDKEYEIVDSSFIMYSNYFGYTFENISFDEIDSSTTITDVRFSKNRYLISGNVDAESYYWECKSDEDGNFDLSSFIKAQNVEASDVLEEVVEYNFGGHTFTIESGNIYVSSYKNLNVVNGFFVVGITNSSIRFNSDILSGFGNGIVDVLISVRTQKDIQNQFEFINSEDDIFLPSGSLSVSEVSEVSSYETANRMYSMNEIEETDFGYKRVSSDTEHKYYTYKLSNGQYIPLAYSNTFGNKIKLCSEDGKQLLFEGELYRAKDRKSIKYSIFDVASEPTFSTLEEANEDNSLRANFDEFNAIIRDKNKYVTNINPAQKEFRVSVDDLSKNLTKVVNNKNENIALWTSLEDFFANVDVSDRSKYRLKSIFTSDIALEEKIETYILESPTQEVDAQEEMSATGLQAVWFGDDETGYFVPKVNIYLSTGLNIPYLFVGGSKNFSTGDFSKVDSESEFESLVTGVYLPQKGYGGHRENVVSEPWKNEKPWDIDPAAFEEDEYLKNKNGEFIYIVDKVGDAVKSENCEYPLYSNGEDISITKDFFSGSNERTISLGYEGGLKKSSLTFKYIPTSDPTVYVSCDNLILGNTKFELSTFFYKEDQEIEVSDVKFTVYDRNGTSSSIGMSYNKDKKVIVYKPTLGKDSSNPSHIRITYKYNNKEFFKNIDVQVLSEKIPSQPSVLVNFPILFFKSPNLATYNYLEYDSLNPVKLSIGQKVPILESWKEDTKPLKLISSDSENGELTFGANNNASWGDNSLTISCENNRYNMNVKLPCIIIGSIYSYFSKPLKDSEEIEQFGSAVRLVLLNLISRINGEMKSSKNISLIETWIRNLIGIDSGDYTVSIMGNNYSTSDGSLIRLNELTSKIVDLPGGEELSEMVKDIISTLYVSYSDFEDYILPEGTFNEDIFGNNGLLYKKVINFYDGVTGIKKFIENASDVKVCYINERKIDAEFIETGSGADVYYKGKKIDSVEKSNSKSTSSCGYYYQDGEDPDVFVTDTNDLKIHIYNSTQKPLIVQGIYGKIICRKPKFATFKELTSDFDGLGLVIEKEVLSTSREDNTLTENAINKFCTIDSDKHQATISESIEGLDSGFVKVKVLTQKTIPTNELMFNDSDSFVKIDIDEIADFPPDRVYFHKDDDGLEDGFPLPPVITYNSNGDVVEILRASNNYAYYNKDYENGNEFPIYECDKNGNFITYVDNELNFRQVNVNDDLDDLHQPRKPLYNTCKDWFKNDFYLKGSESNPFWQVIEISSFFNTKTKNWEQTGKTFEYSKSAKGMKLTKVDNKDRYVSLGKASIYKSTTEGISVETDADFVDLQNGEIRFTIALNENWEGKGEDSIRIVKYGINAYNSFNSFHAFNKENSKVVDRGETATLYSYLTSKYTVNSKENLVSTNDKDASIVPITEIGLFNKQHQMIAYAHFPAIEYRSDTQHLDFTMFIYNGVMKS